MKQICRCTQRLIVVVWILGIVGLIIISQIAKLRETSNRFAMDFLYRVTWINTDLDGLERSSQPQLLSNAMDHLNVPLEPYTTDPLNRRTTVPAASLKPPPHMAFTYPLARTSICRANASDIFLIVIVHSAASHFGNREVIRTTWGNEAWRRAQNLGILFVTGLPVNPTVQDEIVKESAKFGDIIQYNGLDTYRNLTYKTLAGLNYVAQFCRHLLYRYLLKTDDDMFVYPRPLVSYLHQQTPCHRNMTKTIYCNTLFRQEAVHRDPQSKWYVSWQDIPDKDYPPFCNGAGYVLSRDLVEGLLDTARSIPFHWLEDVFVSGMTAKALGGVKHVQMPGESSADGTPCSQPKCTQVKQRWFVHTSQNKDHIKEIFQTVKDYGLTRDGVRNQDCND